MFYIHKDGFIYNGDFTDGARDATAEEVEAHMNPMVTPKEQQAKIQKLLTDSVQAHMDATAKTKGYDNILAAVTYAEETTVPKFQAEGVAFRAWRSAVWEYCYVQLAAVLGGERTVPTAEELIAELPALKLP